MIALLASLAHAQPTAALDAGFPWSQLSATLPLTERLSLAAQYRTALLIRHLPAAGLDALLIDQKWLLIGHLRAGWLLQTGTLASSGPTAAARLTLERSGRVFPTASAGVRGIGLLSQTVTVTADDTTTLTDLTPALSILGTLGVGWQTTEQVRLDVRLTIDQVEIPGFSIPGIGAGITYRGLP